jgi:hypothetical protein
MVGGLTTVSLAATTALTTDTASAMPATLFSSTTAGSYAVTVPGGVTSVTITAVGGTGPDPSGLGGEGGIVTVNATVAPGDSLNVTVAADGGEGGSGAGSGGAGSGSAGGAEGDRQSSTEAPRWLSRGVAVAVAASRLGAMPTRTVLAVLTPARRES